MTFAIARCRSRLFLLAGLLVAPLLTRGAQAAETCVAFLVPPEAPLYAESDSDVLYTRRDPGWLKAFVDGGFTMGLLDRLKVDTDPRSSRNAACEPSDFEEEDDLIHLWLEPERFDKGRQAWARQKDLVPIHFRYPGNWNLQDVAKNVTALQNAAREKLAEIEAAKAGAAAAPPAPAEPAAGAAPPSKPLSRADMERLIEAKVDPDLIEAMIRRSCISFDLDATTLADLSARVPKNVLKAAIECGGKPTATPTPGSPSR